MSLASGLAQIPAGGSTGLTVRFADQNNAPYTGPSTVSFISECVGAGTAEITVNTVLPTTSGTVNATYLDKGCGQTDTVTAQGSANGQSFNATTDIAVTAAQVGSIQFVSATPSIIGIRGGGSGLPEQSTVSFRVLNTASGPAAGRAVSFSLNSTNGGISFSDGETTATGTSGTDGIVSVVVRAGTQLASVRVTATFTDPDSMVTLSTQSSNLTVSTGFPDQDSFSMSITRLNTEGASCFGVQETITMRASDRNNNPVPPNTAITITTEGGDVEGSCFTGTGASTGSQAAGVCEVVWESQNPVPAPDGMGVGGGRSTIFAYAEGEESFRDLNSNGVFDDGDTFTDLGEAFFDLNEDGDRDTDEPYIEFNGVAGFQSAGDTKYNGLICAHSALCSSRTTVTVRESGVIVMGTGNPVIEPGDLFEDGFASDGVINFVGLNDLVKVTVVVRDENDQLMPEDSTVSIATTLGAVDGLASAEVPNSNVSDADADGVTRFTFRLKGPAGTTDNTGTVSISVKVPGSACFSEKTTTYQFDAEYDAP